MALDQSDEEIIILYKEGNQEVFKILIGRYSPALFNFTARLTGKDNAPDMLQEIFIKVWKNLHKFNPEKASFKTWLFTIARNTTTDFLRKKKNLSFSDIESSGNSEETFADDIPDDKLLPDKILDKLKDTVLLNTALEKLRPSYKEVLILHYQEEMTFDEIGKVLNKPLNTVKSQHRRAIIELRKLVE